MKHKTTGVYLCIDAEATCFDGGAPTDMEAIEVDVVIVDEEGAVPDSFRSTIKPHYTARSDYSVALNHITEVDMGGADTLFLVMGAVAHVALYLAGMAGLLVQQ